MFWTLTLSSVWILSPHKSKNTVPTMFFYYFASRFTSQFCGYPHYYKPGLTGKCLIITNCPLFSWELLDITLKILINTFTMCPWMVRWILAQEYKLKELSWDWAGISETVFGCPKVRPSLHISFLFANRNAISIAMQLAVILTANCS